MAPSLQNDSFDLPQMGWFFPIELYASPVSLQSIYTNNGHMLLLLTTLINVVIISNMNAKLMLNERHILSENAFVEMVVWLLSPPLSKSHHGFKYRLALVVNGNCVLRYDNKAGKGDHKHIGEDEIPYIFPTPKALLEDFWNDADKWRF